MKCFLNFRCRMLLKLTVVCLSLLGSYACAGKAQTPTAIVHVTVLDVRQGLLRPDMTVLVSGQLITSVKPSSASQVIPGMRIVDGRGKYLMPGLWDMHVHTNGDQRVLESLPATGITGIRDMGSNLDSILSARSHVRGRSWMGPEMFVAGPMLNGPPATAADDVLIIHSPDEARAAVQNLAQRGVDFIKVHDWLSRDSFITIAQTAKTVGLPFAGHVTVYVQPAEASDLGEKSIEHFEFLPKPCLVLLHAREPSVALPRGCDRAALDQLLRTFSKNGTWLDPTLQSFRYFAPSQWDSILAGSKALVRQIRADHVGILAGTDWSDYLRQLGSPLGWCLHDELMLLVEVGFTPAEAIRAATLNPALFFKLKSEGFVGAGMKANLILLDANPLADIRNTKKIAAVFLDGKMLDHPPHAEPHGKSK
jgi:imidazolonepropionase-like amidohydrolase